MTKINPFRYDILEENSGFLLWQVTHMWQQRQEKALRREIGLTQSQYVILASIYWLNLHGKVITQTYLARHTKIDKMTVSKILKVLQNKMLIQRKTHTIDTRANQVFLTTQGQEVMDKAIKIIESIDTEFFITLKEKIRNFNSYLQILIDCGTI